MNEKVLQTIRKTKLPFLNLMKIRKRELVLWETKSCSQGCFDQGFDKVIIIGNDTPGLITTYKKAHSSLQDTDLVLGPDHKGGAYLIDYQNNFKKSTCFTISWRTSQVIKQLKRFLQMCRFKTFVWF
jgi:glycosyltransferase A (GT-A) superfamily protein (DUF2064 family)